MSTTTFDGPFTEPLVARVTGVKKSVLAHARRSRLTGADSPETGDWHLDKQVVTYSRPGLLKLLTGLGIEFAALDWSGGVIEPSAPKKSAGQATAGGGEAAARPLQQDDDNPPTTTGLKPDVAAVPPKSPTLPAPSEKIADLTVLRVTGPHRLTARTPAGERVALSVQTSENFIRGMVAPGCRRSGDNSLWTFTGRLPRRKGKW